MAKIVIFTPEAEDDSYRGYAWYESRRIGLGREFITAVDACLQSRPRPFAWCKTRGPIALIRG